VTCPQCRLENPASAIRCDCGFSFEGLSQNSQNALLAKIADDVAIIKVAAIVWLVLTALAVAFYFFVGWQVGKALSTPSGANAPK
jgi:hypothetical protein